MQHDSGKSPKSDLVNQANLTEETKGNEPRMFAIEPYFADRRVLKASGNGELKHTWERVRVVGVTKDTNNEPAYLVEAFHGGTSSLAIEGEIKRLEKGNPL